MPETKKLYNAGDRISENLIYSLPGGHDIHCVARFRVEAPAKSYFKIPTTLEFGGAVVQTYFVENFCDRHGHKGVVLVDERRDPETIGEAEPVAATEGAARIKAEGFWLDYCKGVILRWQEEAALARGQGGSPRSPSGFIKRALEVCNILDPTDEIFLRARTAAPAAEGRVAQLERELAEIKDLLKAAAAASGAESKQKKLAAL